MQNIERLNKDQLDAVQETGNIGCSHAATAVSQLLGKNVDISVPDLQIKKVDELTSAIENFFSNDEKVVGVYLELTEEFKGSILMLFSQKSALSLSDALVGQTPGTSTELDEMARSAITEVGNIVVSAYTNALGDLLNSTVMLSPPTFTEDMPRGVMHKVQNILGDKTEHALIFDIRFTGEGNLFDSYFILFPSPESLEVLLNKLGCIVGDQSDEDANEYVKSLLK